MGAATVDTLVIGGGSAGCVLAARLSEDLGHSVLLVEAGPDYGPRAGGRWPADLLDADAFVDTHDWGFPGGPSAGRARVIGGCSAHNGTEIVRPAGVDIDRWTSIAGSPWTPEALRAAVRRAERALRVRPSRFQDLGPMQRASIAAAGAIGIPRRRAPAARGDRPGAGPIPLNADGSVRFNAAFGYLDPARGRSNLTIEGGILADRLIVERGRITGAIVVRGRRSEAVSAGRVVVAAGAYGSPAILIRSGIGDPEDLRRLGVRVVAPLSGVGRGLIDHAFVNLRHRPTAALARLAREHARRHPPTAQATVRPASGVASGAASGSGAGEADRPDLIIGAWAGFGTYGGSRAQADAQAGISVMPLPTVSEGRVIVRSTDPTDLPGIEHGFLSDPGRADIDRLLAGIAIARALAATPPLRRLVDLELAPGPDVHGAALEAWCRANVAGSFHPIRTCRVGSATDPLAVVGADGTIHGLLGGHVVDASILPTMPHGNIHLPVVAVAELIAAGLRGEWPAVRPRASR